MKKKGKIMLSVSLATVAFLLLLVPSVNTVIASATVARVSGVWTLPGNQFSASTLTTSGNTQYIASYGYGPITGGISGSTTAALLLDFNTNTGVILFTGQIECICTIDGRSGTIWISITNGVDQNGNDPDGFTSGNLVIVGSSGGLSGTTGQGSFTTTTSSSNMDYTMKIHLG
jgi:hypothetical protein